MTIKLIQTPSGSIRVCIRNGKNKTEIALGIKSTAEDFKLLFNLNCPARLKGIRLRLVRVQSCIDEFELNHKYDEEPLDIYQARAILYQAIFKRPDPQELKREQQAKVGDFLPFYEQRTAKFARKNTRASYLYTLSVIKKYCPNDGAGLMFTDINYAWLCDMEQWMELQGMSQNTRKIHFGNIRATCRDAYKREITDADPFRRFTFRPAKTRKRSLSPSELRTLIAYPVEPYAEIYRDMFVLIFLLRGINSIDLYNLECIRSGRIEYTRAKTGRLYSVKVEPEAMAIIDKYRGQKKLLCLADRWSDYRNFRHQFNKALRYIGRSHGQGAKTGPAEDAVWPELTSYWARHTWATVASKLDIPKETIAAGLGHGGYEVTDIYIDFDEEKVDRANRKIIDYIYEKS